MNEQTTTNNLPNTGDNTTTLQAGTASTSADSSASRTDPSLLHKVSSLQQENQELLQLRRELEGKLKEGDTTVKDRDDVIAKLKEELEKQRAEKVEKQSKEMEAQFKAFMEDWIESMGKKSPDVIERMKTGVHNMIKEGHNKDSWEVFCAASNLHKENVNAIEELTKTNSMLAEKNKELEGIARTYQGFDSSDARLGSKRLRNADPLQAAPQSSLSAGGPSDGGGVDASMGGGGGGPTGVTDVWGQFENLMHQANSRTVY